MAVKTRILFLFYFISAIITVSLKPTAYYKHLLHKKKEKEKNPKTNKPVSLNVIISRVNRIKANTETKVSC